MWLNLGSSARPGITNIQVGENDVLDSGIVTSPGNEPIRIQLAEDAIIEFKFDYESDSDPSFNAEPDEDGIVITLKNFQAGVTMGGTTPPVGLLEPISIGVLFGRKLSLLFQVSSSKGEDGTAHSTLYYNFYLGEEIDTEATEGHVNVE